MELVSVLECAKALSEQSYNKIKANIIGNVREDLSDQNESVQYSHVWEREGILKEMRDNFLFLTSSYER